MKVGAISISLTFYSQCLSVFANIYFSAARSASALPLIGCAELLLSLDTRQSFVENVKCNVSCGLITNIKRVSIENCLLLSNLEQY